LLELTARVRATIKHHMLRIGSDTAESKLAWATAAEETGVSEFSVK
jgi:hypothetical protein